LQLKPSAVRVALTGGVISGEKIELIRGLDASHLQSGAQNCQRVKYLAQTCNKKKCLALATFFARLRALSPARAICSLRNFDWCKEW
jgi:hypothetical protein